MVVLLLMAAAVRAQVESPTLSTIREDVREGAASSSAPAPPRESGRRSSRASESDSSDYDIEGTSGLLALSLVVATAPFVGPYMWLDDSLSTPGYFPRFPYDDNDAGYLSLSAPGQHAKPWAIRFGAEYAATFDDLEHVGGNLLVSTTSRLGVDTSFSRLREELDGGHDELWLGDCNFVFRFAQSQWAEFRTGLGINWMDDRYGSELGFNFTYAMDFYPRKPWVLSSELDAGTLGHAGLFHFRTTAGIVVRNIELYTGYEYKGIGSTDWNALIGGVRVYF